MGASDTLAPVILVASVGVLDGSDPNGHVEVINAGPVPPEILETLTPDTELAGMIFDRAGRPLWLGRKQRLANAAQRLAVAVRTAVASSAALPCTAANSTTSKNGTETTAEPMSIIWLPSAANTTSGSKPKTS